MKRLILLALPLAILGAACRPAEQPRASARGAPAASTIATATAPARTPWPAPTPSRASALPSSRPAGPGFAASIAPIDAGRRSRMTSSWRSGCPVGFDDLRFLRLSFWGFDGRAHTGELVVHEDVASNVVTVFRKLFEAHFPIQRMRLVDVYGGDDQRSMEANNTSAFNCRRSAGDSGAWSEHSYGRAIDINPVQNPYVTGRTVEPEAGKAYLDRSRRAKGLIRAGDLVVRAFRSIGWGWGGYWTRTKDYQHFSRSGR